MDRDSTWLFWLLQRDIDAMHQTQHLMGLLDLLLGFLIAKSNHGGLRAEGNPYFVQQP